MAKIYSRNSKNDNKLNPKEETIRFLLNYSKALRIIKYKKINFEAILN